MLAGGAVARSWAPSPNGSVVAVHVFENSGNPGLDGKVLVAGGFTRISGVPRAGLALLNPDGTADPNFNVTIEPAGSGVSTMEVSGSAIFIGGGFTHVNGAERQGIARLDLNGDLYNLGWVSPVFNPTRVLHPFANSSVYVLAGGEVLEFALESGALVDEASVGNRAEALVYHAGALYAGGAQGVVRLIKQDGVWETDTEFLADFNGRVMDLIVDPAGEGVFVAGGLFTSFNGQPAPHIVEFNQTGTRNGDLNWPGADPNGQVDRIHYDGNGFLLGGGFTELLPARRVGVGRIFRTLGSLDESFDPGQSVTFAGAAVIRALASTADHVYVGGAFTVYGDGFRTHLMRLSRSTGVLDTSYPMPMAPAEIPLVSPQPYPLPLADIWVRPGDDVQLLVPEDMFVRGWPEPETVQVQWDKDGSPPPPGSVSPDRWSVQLLNARPEDSGIYSVTMENIVGEGAVTFRVNVTDDPVSIPLIIYNPNPEMGELSFLPWQAGVIQTVHWGPATGEPVDIELSTDGGSTWTEVASGLTVYGRYNSWEEIGLPFAIWGVPVPETLTDEAMLRVQHTGRPLDEAAVSGPFEIGPAFLSTIRQWRTTHFGSPEGQGLAADEANWDGDDFSNVMEYGLRSDPTDPASPALEQLPAFSVTVDPTEGIRFNVVLPVEQAPWDLIYLLEESTDLVTWRTFLSSQQEPFGFMGWNHSHRVDGTTAAFYRFRIIRPFP